LASNDGLDGVAVAGAASWIAADAAALLGGAQPVLGAFPDQGALQFRHGAENLQGEPALWGRGVDRIGERFEMRALDVELGDHGQEMRQRTAKRSSLATTSTSPRRTRAIALASSGRDALAPDMCSRKISMQPAALSTSVCASVTCSSVETRA
jgi:hypothetical protein